MSLTVAVITSTIGRDTLHETIRSVEAQTYKAKHYVFVHGKEFWDKSKVILDKYPNVEAVYLPNNNGAGGYGMAPVFALAPFVVKEDIVCYLDDDNWYESNHIESTVTHLQKQNLDWVYSLRKIVDHEGKHICDDDCESLGYFPNATGHYLVDNSCFVLKTEIARKYSHAWYIPTISDRNFLKILMDNKTKAGCTGKATINYRLSKDGTNVMSVLAFSKNNEYMQQKHNNDFIWRQETLIRY